MMKRIFLTVEGPQVFQVLGGVAGGWIDEAERLLGGDGDTAESIALVSCTSPCFYTEEIYSCWLEA